MLRVELRMRVMIWMNVEGGAEDEGGEKVNGVADV